MNQRETVNILCGTDDNYAPFYGIMLTSLFENNLDCSFEVFVFVDKNLSETNERKFRRLEQKYGQHIVIISIDKDLLKDCPISKLNNMETCSYLNQTAYYRLLAPDLLPVSISKVIYLDGDIVINGDIRPLWKIDMTGKAIAFVRDCDEVDKETQRRLGYHPEEGYFNAGVAVYNLDYWRKEKVGDRIFEFIKDNVSQLKYMDQDAVNGVLWKEKVELPARYNFQTPYFAPYFWLDYSEDFRLTLLDECKQAVVIHYCCILKAWDFRYYGGPFYAIWEKYRKMSLWRRSHITKPFLTYTKFLAKKTFLRRRLIEQKRSLWVVLPENEDCYRL